MAGISRSSGYEFAGSTDTLYRFGSSVRFFKIDTGVDLRFEDDGSDEAFEAILHTILGLLAVSSVGATGTIHVCVEAHSCLDALPLQDRIRSIGSAKGAVDLSSTTVIEGTSFTVL
jgi:hypothetical protein